jgi:hypothetical protein
MCKGVGIRNGHRLFGTRLRPSVVPPAEGLSFPYSKARSGLTARPAPRYGSLGRRGEGEHDDKRTADVRAAEESRRAADSAKTSRLRAQRLTMESAEREAVPPVKPKKRK